MYPLLGLRGTSSLIGCDRAVGRAADVHAPLAAGAIAVGSLLAPGTSW